MALPENIRRALLSGGVNLVFHWYNTTVAFNPTGFDAELPKIAALGAGHVRLPISMDMIENGTTGKVRNDRYADLLVFLRRAQQNKLVTIVDIHNTGQLVPGTTTWADDYMGQLVKAGVRARHVSLLVDLADRLGKDADLDWTVLAPANEPIFTTGNESIWYNHQKALIPAMRAVAPGLVLISMAHDWQGIDATLWSLRTPFADDRVIVDVHFYEPMPVSHPKEGEEAAVTYPGLYETWRKKGVPELWDKAKIAGLFTEIAAWRDQHGVFVHCSEFGTKCSVPEAARAAYIGDVASILKGHGFGWTVYDWNTSKAHNFGINMHPEVIKALFGKGEVGSPPPVDEPPVVTPPTYDEATIKALEEKIAALTARVAVLESEQAHLSAVVAEAVRVQIEAATKKLVGLILA